MNRLELFDMINVGFTRLRSEVSKEFSRFELFCGFDCFKVFISYSYFYHVIAVKRFERVYSALYILDFVFVLLSGQGATIVTWCIPELLYWLT